MKRILIFDTETHDRAKNFGKPEDDLTNYPYVLQIAGKIIEVDETATDFNPKVLYTFNYYVKPVRDSKEFIITPASKKIHGLSEELLFKEGQDISTISYLFNGLANAVDYIVAHNIQFDRNVMASELLRLGIKPTAKKGCKAFCTMKYNTNIIKLPNPNYPNSFKFPSLSDMYLYYFKKELAENYNAHDAMGDVNALTDCVLVMLLTDNNFAEWIKGNVEDIY